MFAFIPHFDRRIFPLPNPTTPRTGSTEDQLPTMNIRECSPMAGDELALDGVGRIHLGVGVSG